MIPVFQPLLDEKEIKASQKVIEVGWLGMGKNVGEFEKKISTFLGLEDRYCVAVSTGHAALHLAFLLMDLGPGDEVITPSFNQAADFQAILAVGARPVFCDIDERTLTIDVVKAEKLITRNTKAIVAMDYGCIAADHQAVNQLANKYGIRVVHDAAHSFGSFYKGKKIGTFSDITMFSFDPVKTITCLDGGLLVVKTKDDVRKLHEMRLIGMGQPAEVMYQNSRAWTYDMSRIGFRYHMSNMHAAIGLEQLSKMSLIEKSRRETASFYNCELSSISKVTVPDTDFKNFVPFLYYLRVPSERREALRKHMVNFGVDTGIHWEPGHWFTLLKSCKKGDLTVTETVCKEILTLPLHSNMSQEDQKRVVRSIQTFNF